MYLKKLKIFSIIGVAAIISFSDCSLARSMYLDAEGFPPQGELLPITSEEAQAASKLWRSQMAARDKKIFSSYRAESHLEYDFRNMGGIYSYFTGKTFFKYMHEMMDNRNFVPEEFEVVNCNYSQINEKLVVEQCALPERRKKAQTYGVQETPVIYTYIEIQKDSNGVFSVKNKAYVPTIKEGQP